MKKNEAKKFELFKKILFSDNGLSIKQVVIDSGDAQSTLYRYIRQINDDLSQLFPKTPIYIDQTDTVFFILLPDSLNISHVIDTLCLSYVSVSPEYLILAAASAKNYDTLESLAQSISLSPSYTYKNLNKLNKYLSHFKVKIAFGGSSKTNNLYGSEVNVRFFLCYLYWNILRGLSWPFRKSPDYFKHLPIPIQTKLAPSQLTRLRYFQNITYWRVLSLQKKITLNEDFVSYLIILDAVNPTSFTLEFDNLLTSEELVVEQYYFAFLSRFFIADIDTKEMKVRAAQLFLASQLPLSQSCQQLLDLLRSTYSLTMNDEEYHTFYYHLMLALLYIKYIGNDYKPFVEGIESLASLDIENQNFANIEKELRLFTINFFENDLFFDTKVASGLINHMANLLFYIIDASKKNKPLKIFCQYSKNFYTVDEIKNSLSSIFSSSDISFTDNVQQADIVISDSYEGDIPNHNFFYFATPYDPQTWNSLSQFVHSKLYHSSFFYNHHPL